MSEQLFEDGLAPVILITGLPGEGKTLFAVSQFLKGKVNAFQAGIKGCVFPGVDAAKWFETPQGAVIVVDEAWKWFAPHPPTKEPPEHIARLPEIRHEGRTLVLVTQHPNDLDARVRRRIGKHYHVVRAFGAERSFVHEWNHCHEDVDNRAETENFLWEFDKEAYGLYKSATLHKIKVDVPRKLKRIPVYLGAALLFLVGGVWYTANSLMAKEDPNASAKPKTGMASWMPSARAEGREGRKQGPQTPAEYLDSYTPRIADLPHTAPVYDAVTTPKRAPVIAACVQSASKGCKCYTQQATPLQTSPEVCQQFVAGGMFLAFDPDGTQQATAPAVPPPAPAVVPAIQGQPSAPAVGSAGVYF